MGWQHLRGFFYQMSHLRSMFTAQAHHYLHSLWPTIIAPVCRNGDFMCHGSNGMMKLEHVLPDAVMEGLDTLYEYRTAAMLVVATAAAGTSLLMAYHCCCRRSQPCASSSTPKSKINNNASKHKKSSSKRKKAH